MVKLHYVQGNSVQMSNPVTNSEVEDVLSSIRRLVNDNRRPGSAAPNAHEPDRFVLTPQLRVTEVYEEAIEQHVPETDVLTLLPENVVADTEALDPFEEPTQTTASCTQAEPHDSDAEPAQDPAPTLTMQLSDKIAALETAIAKTADQWEPDGDGRDAYAGTRGPTMSWRDDVELDGTGSPLSLSAGLKPVATVVVADGRDDESLEAGEHILDEESLRILVADIVRSELQGEMGERITRNVRKLVRREILRALAARDLD